MKKMPHWIINSVAALIVITTLIMNRGYGAGVWHGVWPILLFYAAWKYFRKEYPLISGLPVLTMIPIIPLNFWYFYWNPEQYGLDTDLIYPAVGFVLIGVAQLLILMFAFREEESVVDKPKRATTEFFIEDYLAGIVAFGLLLIVQAFVLNIGVI